MIKGSIQKEDFTVINIYAPNIRVPKYIKKILTGTHISIITLNINGLNVPTKGHRLAKWIQKQDLFICCLQETHFRARDTYRLKVRGWK